jgi:hypothetical protein
MAFGVVEDVCLTAVLLVAAELEVVLGGLGADCAALAALATLPLAQRRDAVVVVRVRRGARADARPGARVPWGQNANALVFSSSRVVLGGAHAPLRRSLPAMARRGRVAGGAGASGAMAGLRVPVLLLRRAVALGPRRTQVPRQAAGCASSRHGGEERAVSERVAVRARAPAMAHETHDAIAHAVGEMVLQARARGGARARPERAREALAAVQHTGREAVTSCARC